MARRMSVKQTVSSPMDIVVGYTKLGFNHLLQSNDEVKKNAQKITEANIDEILNDGSISTQKISKVT